MKSRFIHTRRTKLPRKRRSVRLKGSFEDANRWIKCWNCGAINDLERVRTGEGSGVIIEDIDGPPDTDTSSLLGVENINTCGVLIKLGPDGAAITDYYTPRKSYAASGCWFCGTRNLP